MSFFSDSITSLSTLETIDHQDYFREKNINQLLKSLWLGILYHKPDDPVDYLMARIEQLRQNPLEVVALNDLSFLPSGNGSVSLDYLQGHDILDSSEKKMVSSTNIGVGQEKDRQTHQTAVYQRLDSVTTAVSTSTETTGDSSTYVGRSKLDELIHMDDVSEEEYDSGVDLHESLHPDFWRIFKGDMTDLPPLPTNIIRIFLSSTFSDFKAERNKLPLVAYPHLEAWCAKRNFDFQIVDMRWGVTDDVVEDHQVSSLCIEEIKTCQQLSHGPNFVVLLGDRYGWQGFPSTIQWDEFQSLLCAIERLVGEEATMLLKTWFLEDRNAVPPEYLLQPIHTYLSHYLSSEKEARTADRNKWNEISTTLQNMLRVGAKALRECGDFTEEQERKYFMSVTEEEIQQGVLSASKPEFHTMCYHRSLRGIETDTEKPFPKGKFVDLDENNRIDKEGATLKRRLLQEKIQSKLPEENIRTYEVKWNNVALQNSQDREHQDYLERFCDDFVSDMKRMVDDHITRNEKEMEQMDSWKSIYHEVLHHARFGNKKCEVFCGRTDEEKIIRDYLTSNPDSHKPPLIVHGVSGMGKTALMAHVASQMSGVFPKGSVSILRFLGTSPLSSSISETIRSIIDQLSAIYRIATPMTDSLDMFGGIRRRFHSLLDALSKRITAPLVIILDSIDQLLPQNGAHRMLWLPKRLPPRVYIVLSMLTSDTFQCLRFARERLGQTAHYLELPPLSEFAGDSIMDSHLARVKRRLTEEQRQIVVVAFKSLRHPLYLKLVIDKAKQWASYLPTATINILPPNADSDKAVQAAIVKLFEGMELKHGSVFVNHALGYLTCGKGGLTHIEMEDILSCDDEVLNEVYKYHAPPLEGIIRIPSLLWARLQYALKEYTCEKRVDGKVVLAWYHRQFWMTAENMYLCPESVAQNRHRALAELFDQESGIQRTITLCQLGGKTIENADRRVKVQPLDVTNLRKLQATPYHYYRAGASDALISRCLVNYDWLLLRLQALGINIVIQEYELMIDVHPSVALVKKFLELCFDALKLDPSGLAYNIVSRFQDTTKEDILEKFISDARQWLDVTDTPLLVPTHSLEFQPVDSPQTFRILLGNNGKITPNERMVVSEWAEMNTGVSKIQVLDINLRDIVSSVWIRKPTPYEICPDEKHFMFAEDAQINMYELESGDIASQYRYADEDYEKVTVRCIAISSCGEYVCICVKNGRPKNLPTEEMQWKSECIIYLIRHPSQEILKKIKFKGKKILDRLFFVQKDQAIVGVCRNRIIVYDPQTLNIKHDISISGYHFEPTTLKHIPEKAIIIGACSTGKETHVCSFNYEQLEVQYSANAHLLADNHRKVAPFDLYCTAASSKVLVGSWAQCGPSEKPSTNICLYDSDENKNAPTKIPLTPRGYKPPQCLISSPDWKYAFIGWQDGSLGVINLQNCQELRSMSAHDHAIQKLNLLMDGNSLITMSFDNTLKVWDLKRVLKEAASQEEIQDLTDLPLEHLWLHRHEQCLDIDVSQGFLVTVPPNNHSAPRFWSFATGNILADTSVRFQNLYTESLNDEQVNFPSKMHGTVNCFDNDIMVYTRQRRNSMILLVTQGYSQGNVNILVHKLLDMLFFKLLVPGNVIPGVYEPADVLMYSVHDGFLYVYDVRSLNKVKTIEIPKITDEIQDINSTGGKMRLLYYNIGLTVDNRYFLIVNPGGGASGKYMDIIQVQKGKYKKRVQLPKFIPFTFLGDGVYFMCKDKKEEIACYPVTKCKDLIQAKGRDFHYRCLVYTEKFLSGDRTLGLSVDNKKHNVHVWNLGPLEMTSVLRGHTHQVTSVEFSSDKQYLVSASYDNTVRLWMLSSGNQLALFNTYGAIAGAAITPDSKNIVVQAYAAPQKKRGLILEVRNIKNPLKTEVEL